jgi:hypothetical protein
MSRLYLSRTVPASDVLVDVAYTVVDQQQHIQPRTDPRETAPQTAHRVTCESLKRITTSTREQGAMLRV